MEPTGTSGACWSCCSWSALGTLAVHFLDVVEGLPTLVVFRRAKAQATVICRVTDTHRRATLGTLRLAFLSSAARALLADQPILVLDEPTEGLDSATAQAVAADLLDAASGRSVLLLTHHPEGLDLVGEVLTFSAAHCGHGSDQILLGGARGYDPFG